MLIKLNAFITIIHDNFTPAEWPIKYPNYKVILR